jgi:4-amino-4-deoxy-L-arabinose transferase-like glycosyltransferase
MQKKHSLNNYWESFSSFSIWKEITYFILFLGMLLWVVVYLQDRSLFLDEANLARNIVELNYLEFFGPLQYQQYAPPLFLIVEKFCTQLFGQSTYALRIIPLIAGLLSIVLFFRMLQHLKINWWLAAFLSWIFCFTGIYLRYATEAKQYGIDLFFALLLIERALATRNADHPRQLWQWALVGSLSIWFSMPVVFVLSGVGFYFLFLCYTRKDWKKLRNWLGVICTWLLSFAIIYFGILRQEVDSSYLQNYHTPYFYPLFPISAEALGQANHILSSIFNTYWGHTFVTYIIGLPGLILGLIHLFRKRMPLFILLFIPVFACFIASGLKQYSMILRLCLFFLPLLLLITGIGIQQLIRLDSGLLKCLVLVLLLITAASHDRIIHFSEDYEIEDPKSALIYLEEAWKPGDRLYLGKWAIPAYTYYSMHHPGVLSGSLDTIIQPINRLNEIDWTQEQRIWLLYTHLVAPEETAILQNELNVLEEKFQVADEHTFTATKLLRLNPKFSSK